MEVNPLAELPLAVFTTLMPISAGSIAMMIVARIAGLVPCERLRAVDTLSVVPLAIAAVGFLGAAAHLASPLHAMNVVFGIGASPLSNEVFVAGAYAVALFVYAVLGWMGRMERVRTFFQVVLLALAVVLAVFTGLAYYVGTIPSWANVWPTVQELGFLLMGSCIGLLVLSAARAPQPGQRILLRFVPLAGLSVASVATAMQIAETARMQSWVVSGADLAAAAVPFAVVGAVLGLVGSLVCLCARGRAGSTAVFGAASVLVVAGVFVMRLSFYCLQMNVGL